MQRTLFNTLSTQVRRTAHVARSSRVAPSVQPASTRLIWTSPRLAFPGPNPAPTASEVAVAADRGETVEEDVTTTVKQTVHKVVHKDSQESHDDPHHPGKSDIEHLESPSLSEEAVHADKHASDPLADHTKAASTSSTTSHQTDAQHPGKAAGVDHLENPSLSEAFVHADREGADPLAGKTVNAKSNPAQAASGIASNLANAADKVAGAVKDAVGLGGKKSFSTSARQSTEEKTTPHLDKSGHDHLDKPSLPEEEVHADKTDKDPLSGTGLKASERKGDKAGVAETKSQQSSKKN
ncbi:uncharacterized protein JCM15063_001247 [Sporobolomyces koalae]|uniref:uncharacterized protein n=1 Tax=Sporobolomyces koalae TaxID=500713 RepID=UPI0031726AE7